MRLETLLSQLGMEMLRTMSLGSRLNAATPAKPLRRLNKYSKAKAKLISNTRIYRVKCGQRKARVIPFTKLVRTEVKQCGPLWTAYQGSAHNRSLRGWGTLLAT